MNKEPLVSVVIPAYNMARYLPDALDSVLAQNYRNVEAVVVDDGSTDNTCEVTARYTDRYLDRIRYIRQENQGVAGALNTAVTAARGDYVRLLAADDIFLPDSTAVEVELMEAHPEVGMVCGQGFPMDADGRPLPGLLRSLSSKKDLLLTSEQAFRWLLRGSHVVCGTVMMRRSAMDRAGPFYQRSVPGEDWDMFLRIVAYSGLAYLARPMSYYRIHDGSLTAGFNVQKLERSHAFILENLYAREDLPFCNTKTLAYAYNYLTLALLGAYCRDMPSYVANVGRAVRQRPLTAFSKEMGVVLFEGARAVVPVRIRRIVKQAVQRATRIRQPRRGRLERASEELEHT